MKKSVTILFTIFCSLLLHACNPWVIAILPDRDESQEILLPNLVFDHPLPVDFGVRTLGYEELDPITVTIRNTGGAAAENIHITIRDTEAFSENAVFALRGADLITSINAGEYAHFDVLSPITGLPYNTYSAAITVSYEVGKTLSGNVAFAVQPPPEQTQFTVTMTHDGHGSALARGPHPGDAEGEVVVIEAGDTVTIRAIPDNPAMYAFEEWALILGDTRILGDMSTTESTTTFTMPRSNLTIKALFELRSYALTIELEGDREGSGTVFVNRDPVTGPVYIKVDDEITIYADPDEGFLFTRWEIVSGSITRSTIFDDPTEREQTLTMPPEDVTLKAVFEDTMPILDLTPNPLVFGEFPYLYTAPAAQTITITNTGHNPAVNMIISHGVHATWYTWTGDDFTDVILPETEGSNTITFTVQPKAGFAVGVYDTLVEITYGNNRKASCLVKFEVIQAHPSLDGNDDTINWPSGLTAKLGDTLAKVAGDIGLAQRGNSPDVKAGTFAWKAPGSTPVGGAGQRLHTMVFTPYDTNYRPIEKDIAIVVSLTSQIGQWTYNPVTNALASWTPGNTHTYDAANNVYHITVSRGNGIDISLGGFAHDSVSWTLAPGNVKRDTPHFIHTFSDHSFGNLHGNPQFDYDEDEFYTLTLIVWVGGKPYSQKFGIEVKKP